MKYFNPRSPCGERPVSNPGFSVKPYFNPRSPCGERPFVYECFPLRAYFNPRSPCGERPALTVLFQATHGFQSTLPVRGATGAAPAIEANKTYISIHAPRAGSDRENSDHYPDFQIILVWLFVSGRIWLLILNISQSI